MFTIVPQLEPALSQLTADELGHIVVVESSPEWPDLLVFQPWSDEQLFYQRYSGWISRYLVINELYNLKNFIGVLESDGFVPVFAPSAQHVLDAYDRHSTSLEIPGYNLYPFQSFGLRQALERARTGTTTGERLFFWNWSAGAGKSMTCAAGAKALFDSGDIDLVIACTLSKLKINLCRNFVDIAGLNAIVNDHSSRDRRHARYEDPDIRVFVMNYEKLWVDEEALAKITDGKRVLFVLDEGHRLIGDGAQNKARKALDRLTKDCHATVWPMSATVVGGNPLRFRDVFSLDGHPRLNPLGSKKDFTDRYAWSVKEIPIKTKTGGRFNFIAYNWNLSALQDVRHRIADRTMTARKTDPGIREQFKGIDCIPVMVQATREQQKLFDAITELARVAKKNGEALTQHYLALRVAAINPGALKHSDNEVAKQVVADHPALIDAKHSAKIEVINDMLDGFRQAQDKVVLFCHWTNQGLLPLSEHFTVPYVLHYGTGQSAGESQAAQDKFKSDPDITLFASSDAGTHGLNLQEARYVINADPTYSYDDLAQRNARIDRVDSHLSGLTAYVLIVEGSVEQRVWETCEKRRVLASAVQGTDESLSYGENASFRNEMDDLDQLIFGAQEG